MVLLIFPSPSNIPTSVSIEIVCICQILEKEWKYNGPVHQLVIDFEKACDSVRREELYNILTEFGIPMKLVRLIKMCLNETYTTVCIHINLMHFLF
jgi:hypothetical protein